MQTPSNLDETAKALAHWIAQPEALSEEDLRRLLQWAAEEFDREDYLPAPLSQRYSFREPPPNHITANLLEFVSFLPSKEERPKSTLVAFLSTPDQFSARLSIAHDFCIRHKVQKVLLVCDYFDNQALRQPASTFRSIWSSQSLDLAFLLYTSFGFHFFSLLVAQEEAS